MWLNIDPAHADSQPVGLVFTRSLGNLQRNRNSRKQPADYPLGYSDAKGRNDRESALLPSELMITAALAIGCNLFGREAKSAARRCRDTGADFPR
jgi:hypothetical protein